MMNRKGRREERKERRGGYKGKEVEGREGEGRGEGASGGAAPGIESKFYYLSHIM